MSLRGRTTATTVTGSDARFLVVACQRTPVALPADLVRGILQPDEVPEGRDITVQGVVYPLSHLAGRWEWAPTAAGPDRRVVLCSDGARAQAIMVDRVMGLVDVARSRLTPLPLHFAAEERNWIAALFLFEDSVALVVHAGCLLGPAEEAKSRAVLEPPPQPAAEAAPPPAEPAAEPVEAEEVNLADQLDLEPLPEAGDAEEIGRASCRERV